MKLIRSKFFLQILIFIALLLSVLGFAYFEPSFIIRSLVILLGAISLLLLKSNSETLVLLIFYLGLYDLYNVRYGLAVPLFLILIVVFSLTCFLFYYQFSFYKITENIDRQIFNLYLVTIGLMVLETFLAMSLWPVDPKTKSLVIVVTYYVSSRLFYLYANNVLHSKRVLSILAVSVLILGGVFAFGMLYGF